MEWLNKRPVICQYLLVVAGFILCLPPAVAQIFQQTPELPAPRIELMESELPLSHPPQEVQRLTLLRDRVPPLEGRRAGKERVLTAGMDLLNRERQHERFEFTCGR